MTNPGLNFSHLAEQAAHLQQVRKTDLTSGDRVIVKTRNSTYCVHVVGDGWYLVSGGWFDRKGLAPLKTTISGCTLGGSAIKCDIIAACGLHIEFGNRVLTSEIERIYVFRGPVAN